MKTVDENPDQEPESGTRFATIAIPIISVMGILVLLGILGYCVYMKSWRKISSNGTDPEDANFCGKFCQSFLPDKNVAASEDTENKEQVEPLKPSQVKQVKQTINLTSLKIN